MKPITALADEETLTPYWLTEKQDVILKVKEKIMLTIEPLRVGKVALMLNLKAIVLEKKIKKQSKDIL